MINIPLANSTCWKSINYKIYKSLAEKSDETDNPAKFNFLVCGEKSTEKKRKYNNTINQCYYNLQKLHTSKISSRETSIRQCPVCGCSACSSCRSIFIFWTRSRLYFGNGESLSTRHALSPLCGFWHGGGTSVDEGGGIKWSANGGGGGCPITVPALVTMAGWVDESCL